jgi:hypothetical protein
VAFICDENAVCAPAHQTGGTDAVNDYRASSVVSLPTGQKPGDADSRYRSAVNCLRMPIYVSDAVRLENEVTAGRPGLPVGAVQGAIERHLDAASLIAGHLHLVRDDGAPPPPPSSEQNRTGRSTVHFGPGA